MSRILVARAIKIHEFFSPTITFHSHNRSYAFRQVDPVNEISLSLIRRGIIVPINTNVE